MNISPYKTDDFFWSLESHFALAEIMRNTSNDNPVSLKTGNRNW